MACATQMDCIPRIDGMSVDQYDITAKVFPMMCVVENRLNFQPNTIAMHDDSKAMEVDDKPKTAQVAKFSYPLHGSAKINKFIAHIVPSPSGLSEEERKEKTITIEAKIENKDEARTKFEKAKSENKAAILTTLDDAAADSFICELGAIPPNHEVNCEFSYFLVLKEQLQPKSRSDDAVQTDVKTLRLHIPMEFKERYVAEGTNAPELNKGHVGRGRGFSRSMVIETQHGRNITGTRIDGSTYLINQDPTNTQKWLLDENQLNSTNEDIELYIQIGMQPITTGGEFTSAFEFYPEKKEAIFCVHVNPTNDYEEVDPEKKVSIFSITFSLSIRLFVRSTK